MRGATMFIRFDTFDILQSSFVDAIIQFILFSVVYRVETRLREGFLVGWNENRNV